jgi:hypothetical protein
MEGRGLYLSREELPEVCEVMPAEESFKNWPVVDLTLHFKCVRGLKMKP